MNKPPVIEFSLSLMSLWWAFVFFNRPDILNDVPLFFESIAENTTPSFWGGVFVAGSLAKIIGYIAEKRMLRLAGLYFSTVFYASISAGYFLGAGGQSIGFGIFAIISYMALSAIKEVGTHGTS